MVSNALTGIFVIVLLLGCLMCFAMSLFVAAYFIAQIVIIIREIMEDDNK